MQWSFELWSEVKLLRICGWCHRRAQTHTLSWKKHSCITWHLVPILGLMPPMSATQARKLECRTMAEVENRQDLIQGGTGSLLFGYCASSWFFKFWINLNETKTFWGGYYFSFLSFSVKYVGTLWAESTPYYLVKRFILHFFFYKWLRNHWLGMKLVQCVPSLSSLYLPLGWIQFRVASYDTEKLVAWITFPVTNFCFSLPNAACCCAGAASRWLIVQLPT